MVLLRIWSPLSSKENLTGYSSILLNNPHGSAYMSVRALKVTEGNRVLYRSATLADDIEAAGADTLLTWKFTRLDEARMLRIWDQYRTTVSVEMREVADAKKKCFSFCDWAIAAGRGFDVNEPSVASFKKRAEGALCKATLANSYAALAGRADHYLKFERW